MVSSSLRYCVITCHKLNTYNKAQLSSYSYVSSTKVQTIEMVKRCIAADCSNMNSNGISLFQFPQDPALHAQWIKEVQRTRADCQGPSDYSVLCSNHFTNDCFEEDTIITARFGIEKRRQLKPNAIPTVFYRQSSTQALQVREDYKG